MSLVEHPQSNGQVKIVNNVIFIELKYLTEELPKVLRAYRYMSHVSTGETLFNFMCIMGAMLLVEVGEPTIRRKMKDMDINSDCLQVTLDSIEIMQK